MMRRLLGVVAVAGLAVAGLAACGSDPHKNMHCVRSHDQSYEQPIYGYMMVGKVTVPYVISYIPETQTVCDQWVPNAPAATHG